MSKSWGSRVRRAAAAGVALIIAGSALAACTIEQDGNAAENSEATETTEEVKDDPAEISVEDGAEDVEPVVPVTVTAPAGLEKVTMTNEDGKEVEAELNDDKTEWTTAEPLGYSREYTVEATTESGKTSTATFSTVTPSAQSTAW